jgi:cytochrome c1
MTKSRIVALAVALAAVLAGCGGEAGTVRIEGADPDSGRTAMKAFGCGGCHTIPGVDGATGRIGPSLDHIDRRSTIAGRLPSTPDNLVRWIMEPQVVDPGNLMPDLGVPERQAKDIAAYLYSR